MAEIKSLPEIVLEKIFHYLSVKDLIKCSRVCKKWHALLSHENSAVWQSRFYEAGTEEFRDSKHLSELDTYKAKVLCYECAWNDQDRSHNIYIKNDCLTLHRKPVAQSSDGIRTKIGFTSGLHYFVIIFHGPSFGSSALVGVSTKNAPVHCQGYTPLLGNDDAGWAWDLSQHCLRHDGKVVEEVSNVRELSSCRYIFEFLFSPPQTVSIGNKIGLTLDMDIGMLEFDINGRYVPAKFTNLPKDQPLYPSISAVYGNSEVTLIYYGKPIIG